MKKNVDKQNEFIAKVLKILECMNGVTTSKILDRIALIKDEVRFGFIRDEEIYLVDKTGKYNKFLKTPEINQRSVQDELLMAATQSYLDACRENA